VYARSGPVIEVPNHTLTAKPVTFSYLLTSRFRFVKAGEYRVRLMVEIGLNDETTRRGGGATVKPHSVSVTREIVLRVVAAE
jgi:hypothetical protein